MAGHGLAVRARGLVQTGEFRYGPRPHRCQRPDRDPTDAKVQAALLRVPLRGVGAVRLAAVADRRCGAASTRLRSA